MASFVHLIDQRRLIGPGGSTVSGNIYFYYSGTNVLAPVFQDVGMSVPSPNPVSVGAGEVVPLLFLDTSIIYRRVIIYSDGTIDEQDPLGELFSEGELGLPVGSIIDYAGTVAPDGFLLCFGQEVDRAEFADLFAAIGVTYGSGNGSTTFNLPDGRGRVTAGKDNMGGVAASRLTSATVDGLILGQAGGEEVHVLTIAELAAHNHGGVTTGTGVHSHNVPQFLSSTPGPSTGARLETGVLGAGLPTATDGSHTHTIPSQGSSSGHNNIQPTIVLNKIIKTSSTTFLSLIDLLPGFDQKANAVAIGIAPDALNMGDFTGVTIPADSSAKEALQALETGLETAIANFGSKANAVAIGISDSAIDMGSFSGTTIPDNVSAKVGLQSLETAVELRALSAFSHSSSYAAGSIARKLQDSISIVDAPYNADRTGVASAVAAINAAFTNAIITGRSVYAPAGTYLIDGDVTNPGVTFYGDGEKTLLKRSGLGNIFKNSYTLPTSGGHTLASDASANSTSITLTAGHGASFTIGTYAVLVSNAYYDTPNLDPQRKGEFVRIKNIVGDVITLGGPLMDTYLTADTAELLVASLTAGIEYREFACQMDKTVGTVGGANSGTEDRQVITTRFALRPKFNNITMFDSLGAGIALEGCIGASVEGHFCYDFGSATNDTNGTATDGFGGYGYGISERGLNIGLVANRLYYERIRHGYTNGSSYIFTKGGRPVGASINDGTHKGAKLSGWDTHQLGIGQRFNNCWSFNANGVGFTSRCDSVVISGGGAIGCLGSAIALYKGSTENAENTLVDGFYAKDNNWGTDFAGTNWTLRGTFLDMGTSNTIRNFIVDSAGGPLYETAVGTTNSKLMNGFAKLLNNGAAANKAIWLRDTGASPIYIRGVDIDVSNGGVSDLVRNDSTSGNNIPTIHDLRAINGSISGKMYNGAGVGTDLIVHWTGSNKRGRRRAFTLNGSNTLSLAGFLERQITVTKTAAETLDTVTGNFVEGDELLVIAGTGGITITHSASGANTFFCKGSVNATVNAGTAVLFVNRSGAWIEISRSF